MPNRLAMPRPPRTCCSTPTTRWTGGSGSRGVRGGPAARRADAAERRVRRVPLVPRDGARVVRGRGDGGVPERALRQHQGRPRGAARRRCGLHGGDQGDDRAGRLADDVVLDHDGNPFFAGTYFPHQPRHGQPASRRCWRRWPRRGTNKPRGRAARGGQLREHLQRAGGAGRRPITEDVLAARSTCWSGSTTRQRRLRRGAEVPTVDGAGVPAPTRRPARDAAGRTLDAMARGGIYDQLGGGFARYSVDAAWVVPHFEKMLYDNARCSASTPGSGGRSATGSPARPPTSCSASCARPRVVSRPRSTPTARASRASSTRGPRSSSSRCSARTTAPGPPGSRGDGGRHVRARQLHAAAMVEPDDPRGSRAARDVRRGCSRPVRSGSPGPRRQGGGRLERTGDHRALRGGAAPRRAG